MTDIQFSHRISEWVSQCGGHLVSHPVSESVSHSVSQSVTQWVSHLLSQSAGQSVSQSVRCSLTWLAVIYLGMVMMPLTSLLEACRLTLTARRSVPWPTPASRALPAFHFLPGPEPRTVPKDDVLVIWIGVARFYERELRKGNIQGRRSPGICNGYIHRS